MAASSPAATEAAKVRRGPGRPRDPEVERRMKQAALEVLAEHGPAGATLERICDRAGAPRATFYRRWDKPIDALIEAFNEGYVLEDLPDTGDVVRDLVLYAGRLVALYSDPLLGPCAAYLSTEAHRRPEIRARMRQDLTGRRAWNRQILERASARAAVAERIDPDLLLDVISGLAGQHAWAGRPFVAADYEQVIRRLLRLEAAGSSG